MQVYVNQNNQRIAFVTHIREENYIVSVYSSLNSHNLREEPLGTYELTNPVNYESILYALPNEEGPEGWTLKDIDDSEFNFVVES